MQRCEVYQFLRITLNCFNFYSFWAVGVQRPCFGLFNRPLLRKMTVKRTNYLGLVYDVGFEFLEKLLLRGLVLGPKPVKGHPLAGQPFNIVKSRPQGYRRGLVEQR